MLVRRSGCRWSRAWNSRLVLAIEGCTSWYFIDHTDADLLRRLRGLRSVRVERAERIACALAKDGFSITLDDVLAAADGGSVGRAHVARHLEASGQVASVAEAFATLLGKTAPYYVPKPVQPPAVLIEWIVDAGGVAVLAHPGLSRVDDLIPSLVAAGLAGVEVYHPSHDDETCMRYQLLASELGILVTGGSDFHGLGPADPLGTLDVPTRVMDDLASAHLAVRT